VESLDTENLEAFNTGSNLLDDVSSTDIAAGDSMEDLFVANFGDAFIEAVVMPLVQKRTKEIADEMRNE